MNRPAHSSASCIHLVAVIEASRFTGPARNLAEVSRRGLDQRSTGEPGLRLLPSIVTFVRGCAPQPDSGCRSHHPFPPTGVDEQNEFVGAARRMGLEVDVIRERGRFDPSTVRQLRQVIDSRSPDIVQTHNVKSHFLTRLSRPHGHSWVAFHHGYTQTDFKDRLYNLINRWSLPAADRVITVSHAFARELAASGVRSERIRVIHNSIEPDRFKHVSDGDVRSLRSQLNLAPEERMILSIGRLSAEKGHLDLLTAFARLAHQHPELRLRLVILGEGPERSRIVRAARCFGLGERIVLAGHVQHPGTYLAAAHLLALPSHSEGSPNVLLESMIARLPVVATAVGGVPEIVTDRESVRLVRARDPEGMAAALYELLTHPELAARLAERAYEIAIHRHTPAARLQLLLSVYRELLPGGVPHSDSGRIIPREERE